MNRLIIIGNGFDLAHGLPTKYKDFIDWLIKEEIRKSFNKPVDYNSKARESTNNLFEVLNWRSVNFDKNHEEWLQKLKLEDNEIYFHKKNEFHFESHEERINRVHRYDITVEIYIKSELFDACQNDGNWADIEKTYFELLISKYKTFKNKSSNKIADDITRINSDLEKIKNYFKQYLGTLQIKNKKKYLTEIINDNIEPYELDDLVKILPHQIFEEIEKKFDYSNLQLNYFVNFNYTRLLEKYLNINHPDIRYSSIHGTLENDNIIFGYGDDSHEYYKKLEEEDVDELIKNVKSFFYPFSRNYRNILNFIDSGYYEVVVIGHSLSLSDRVFLKTIFEHNYCKAIRLYHRGEKSYKDKIIALSRHFDNKIAMRRKIVEYDPRNKLS